MEYNRKYEDLMPKNVLHWNYRGFTEFPLQILQGEESEVTDIYLKENLISRLPKEIYRLAHLESLYLSGNDITELPKEISFLKYLKCLDISGNRLKCVPDEIGDVKQLKFLILDENELTELPLRLIELKSLLYLSVCDNKLKWLPQRPVYNYHHCEFRFWRNEELETIPYSLWYHMFRGQQTRSLNIGCLRFPKQNATLKLKRFRLDINSNGRTCSHNVECPQYANVMKNDVHSPPSLLELSRRELYNFIFHLAQKITANDYNIRAGKENLNHLNDDFEDNGNITRDINANIGGGHTDKDNGYFHPDYSKKDFAPADVVRRHLSYLPVFVKRELCNGPISKCDNVECKKSLFDCVYVQFSIGTILLIDRREDAILNAVFCSKHCTDKWKRGKNNLITSYILTDSTYV